MPFLQSRSRNPSLPPGPKGLPVVGNVLDMPKGQEWKTFAEWGRQYGGICSVSLMGQPMIIVNSAEIMAELDKKSSIYSDRPRLEMGGELVGYSKTLVLIPYGDRFKAYRRHISRMIGTPKATSNYHAMEEVEMHKFLKRVAENPDELPKHLRKFSGAVIMKLAYGIEVQESNDPFVELIEEANDNFNLATAPGAFFVDVFPSLRRLPAGFPGAGFQALAAKWAKAFNDMVEVPYAYAQNLIHQGKAPSSFLTTALENERSLTEEDIFVIKHTAASLYGAGADTGVAAQHAFFLAMIRHPDVQRKAQAEIDAVIGSDRLPGFSDRDRLPYVNAVVTEALRWHSVAPTGVPHRATEDGVIAGYYIPKGSLIIANLWNMLHDPEVYPNPFVFDPERHVGTPEKPAQRDPRQVCFGFGRRICPGLHLAEASLWLCIAMSLAVFDIRPEVGEDGEPIIPEHENTSGTISHPVPFKFRIKPRSQKALALIAGEIAH
ncbi:cytochrome P450 [Marasmius fiardii PR-910]|nr:cytochrome P450 [Marasmius fiardii PR-910]